MKVKFDQIREKTYLKVSLDEIVPNDLIIGPDPTPQFIKSVGRIPVFDPVILQLDKSIDPVFLSVKAGGRRVKASRIHGREEIPAIIYPADTKNMLLISLHENEQRAQNLISAYLIVKDFLDNGSSIKEVAELMDKPISRVRDILKLDSLHPELLNALKEDKIKTSTATRIAKLEQPDQQLLVEKFKETGKVTSSDVGSVRSCSAAELGKVLPQSVFDMPVIGFSPKAMKEIASLSADEIRSRCNDYAISHPKSKSTINALLKSLLGE